MGPQACGQNFRLFLEQTPTYVNGMSSLLGGYYTVFSPYVKSWDPTQHWTHLEEDHERYNIVHGIASGQHFGIDLKIGLELGLGGILRKIRTCRREHDAPDQAFYGALEDVVIGIQHWIENHTYAAEDAAGRERNVDIRENLVELVAMNRWLVTRPPRTFREACQWIAWFQMAARMYNGSGAVGRLDHYLYPFYARDLADGILDREQAVLHLACLNLSDPQYYHVGGITPDGEDATNDLSFLVLEAVERLRIPANVSVGIHPKMDRRLLRRSIEVLANAKLGIPRFFGAENVARGYAKNGIPLDVARRREQVGCHWTCLPGIEYSFSDVIKVNFAKVLDAAIQDIRKVPATMSVEALWNAFDRHLKKAVNVAAQGIDLHMENKHKFSPELVLDLLCHGPLEKGVDASHGSLEHNTICIDGSALATAADSLAALECHIEKRGELTWEAVLEALDTNFVSDPRTRALLGTTPAFGRDGALGDLWAKRIAKRFTELVTANPSPQGFCMVPGLFSWASTIPMGKATPATANGRLAGSPISFGANPDNGVRKGGPLTPTGLARAVAEVQPGFGNAAPMQLDIDPGLLDSENGVEQLETLIWTHFELGGTLVNANVLGKADIKDACDHPEKYPDLVVRVTGFSAYFASLSDEFRRLVYSRIVSEDG